MANPMSIRRTPLLPMYFVVVAALLFLAPSLAEENSSTATTSNATPEVQEASVPNTDSPLDDRSWLDVFGEVAKDYLTHQVIPPTDASCSWDWRVARCEPYCLCTFRAEWGDYHLGRSCRERLKDDVVCSSDTHFDPVRLLEYVEDEQAMAQAPQNNNWAKQVLFQTVKGLQWSRNSLQKWTLQWRKKTEQKYERWQDQTCASIEQQQQSCIPPSNLTWKEKLLCRDSDSLCEDDDDTTSFIKDKLLFWKRKQERNSEDGGPSYSYLPNWSTASDWSAGVNNSPRRHKKKRRPRVNLKMTHTNGGGGGFGGMPIQKESMDSSVLVEKDISEQEKERGMPAQKEPMDSSVDISQQDEERRTEDEEVSAAVLDTNVEQPMDSSVLVEKDDISQKEEERVTEEQEVSADTNKENMEQSHEENLTVESMESVAEQPSQVESDATEEGEAVEENQNAVLEDPASDELIIEPTQGGEAASAEIGDPAAEDEDMRRDDTVQQ